MNAQATSRPAARCPVCRTETEKQWRPFCSKRCSDVDLGRWLTGGYAIPADEVDDFERPDEL